MAVIDMIQCQHVFKMLPGCHTCMLHSCLQDLLYAMEVMLGATHWADKDSQAMKKLEAIANSQPAQVRWLSLRGDIRSIFQVTAEKLCTTPRASSIVTLYGHHGHRAGLYHSI